MLADACLVQTMEDDEDDTYSRMSLPGHSKIMNDVDSDDGNSTPLH